ncbi:MAG: alpha/beta fold hydrolase, partial [Bacteriovoracaceae bacterium]
MKKIIAIHGNPGHSDDWNEVKKLLPKDTEFLALDAYDPELGKKLRSFNGPFILTGFSLGCYTIMRYLPEIKDKVSGLVFVAPYLSSEKPLSGTAKALLGVPLLNGMLIESSKKKSVGSFLENMIHPQKMADHPYYQTFLQRLETTDLWAKTVKRKIDAENNPLTHATYNIPVIALWGKEDKTSSRERQSSHLRGFSSVEHKDLTGGGHALLWSHSREVADALSQVTDVKTKTGYYPGVDIRNNVLNYLEDHLRDFPMRIALRWARRGSLEAWDKTMTSALPHDEINYAQIAGRINAFANGLKKIGITKGDRIIIFLPMSLDMYVAMFAVQRIGAIAVFLDSWARANHLGATAECVGPKGMVSFAQAFQLVDQVPEFKSMPIRIMYGPGENFTHKFEELMVPGDCPMEPVESETTALITFTTGSTGKPKGANRTHRFLSAQHHALSHVIPYAATDIDMPIFPIFSLNNLATGVTTVLPAINLAQPSELDPAILTNQILNN